MIVVEQLKFSVVAKIKNNIRSSQSILAALGEKGAVWTTVRFPKLVLVWLVCGDIQDHRRTGQVAEEAEVEETIAPAATFAIE